MNIMLTKIHQNSQGDAELIYGDFRSRLPAELQETVYAATKWCIFGPLNRPVTTEFVLDGVRERARRLGGRVELLQFHWYDVRFLVPFSFLPPFSPSACICVYTKRTGNSFFPIGIQEE